MYHRDPFDCALITHACLIEREMNASTIDSSEVAKFQALAQQWWDLSGPFKTLHDINPVRVKFIEQQGSVKGLKCLDVGCGGGILSEALAKLGAEVVGIDMSDACIQVAQEHAKQQALAVDYEVSAIENFKGGMFDRVICLEMLEHVSDPAYVIRECTRLLKPNGLLFLSTIHRSLRAYLSAIVAAEYVLNLLPRQTHDYDKFIQPSELAAMVRSAGLEVKALKGMGYNPLTRQAYLQDSVAVNYLTVCQWPTSSLHSA